jgi:hypothetical protein
MKLHGEALYCTIQLETSPFLSPVVHVSNKSEEELPQEGDGLLYLVGDTSNAGLEVNPDSLPPSPLPHYIL